MFEFLGYNFALDKNSLDPAPTSVEKINQIQIQNGIYDEMLITKDTNFSYTTTFPDWDYNTIFDAKFEGDLSAGNIGFLSTQISEIRVKRRVKGTFDWLTIGSYEVTSFSDITKLVFNDYFNENNVTYEYAFVPVVQGIEGQYIINEVFSQFDGIFIADINSIYKFYSGVSYGSSTRVQKVGVFEPIGKKYPIVVSNSLLNYETGSVSGNILPKDYLKNRILDRYEMAEERKAVEDFLTTKSAKVLKDWNGNIWCVFVTDSPTINYDSNYGMGLTSVDFSWTEVGDLSKQEDWDANSLVKER
nr:MAG TPA: hypothetical protein [Caudoviricetes sp.]